MLEPNTSTTWYWEKINTEVEWIPGLGSTVRMEIWKDGSKIADYCDWTDDDGSYTRSSAIPEAWGEGDNYQIKMIDDINAIGWSEEFAIINPPSGSIYNPSNGHYYLFNKTSLGWNEARMWAESFVGGHLVVINSQNEQNWLNATFGTGTNAQYWIGFTDVEQESNWLWMNGDPVTYTNWAPDGQPDGSGDYGWCGYSGSHWDDHPEYGNNFDAIVEI